MSPERRRLRRVPLIVGAGITVLLIGGALFPIAPLQNAETRAAVTDASLRLSPAFVATAPVNNTLDAMSLLSVREHIALLLALACVYVLYRSTQKPKWAPSTGGRGGTGPRRRVGRWPREAALVGATLLGLVVLYATMILVPRPMAALRLVAADSDLVVIDFHSHTNASHDGRPVFTAAHNRAWHHAAGFDVVYVTDHFTFAGAQAGTHANPPLVGGGTVLLSGIEVLEGGEHVNVLGVTAADSAMLHDSHLLPDSLRRAVAQGRAKPIILQTIPGPLDRVPGPNLPDVVPVDAIEISDGAPRGFSMADDDHVRILHIADSLQLAVVAGSDHHGWGRTAAAWSVMAMPGWRRLTPDTLERRIEATIATDRRRAGRVIERTRPIWAARTNTGIGSWAMMVIDGFAFLGRFVWQLFATRSWPERLSWLAWTWVIVLAYRALRPMPVRRFSTYRTSSGARL